MMPAVDPDHARLLRRIQPRPPHSKEEHARLLAEIETLMMKGENNLTPAESAMLEMLFNLVHEYEQATYPPEPSTPAEILEFLMEQNTLKPADLPLPASRVSETLSGKRAVSVQQAFDLAELFRVSPALFLARK
jgi:HTH-type transcriptional regulator/antitoxin HigA